VGPNGEENGIPSNGDLPEPVEDLEPMFEPGEVAASSCGDFEVKVWELDTGKMLHSFRTGLIYVHDFSPCGSKVLVRSQVWDIEKEEAVTKFDEHIERVDDGAFSPCGSIVVTKSDNYAFMWNAKTGETIKEFELEDARHTKAVDFSPSGDKFFFVNKYREIIVVDRTGEKQIIFDKHEGSIWAGAEFSHCGEKIVSGCRDGEIYIWDPESGEVFDKFENKEGIYSISISFCGELLACGERTDSVSVWNIETEEVISTFDKHDSSVHNVGFTSCGEKVLSSTSSLSPMSEGIPLLWEVETGEVIFEFDEHTDASTSTVIYKGIPGE